MNKELVNNIVERIIMGILLLWSVAGAIAYLPLELGGNCAYCLILFTHGKFKTI